TPNAPGHLLIRPMREMSDEACRSVGVKTLELFLRHIGFARRARQHRVAETAERDILQRVFENLLLEFGFHCAAAFCRSRSTQCCASLSNRNFFMSFMRCT